MNNENLISALQNFVSQMPSATDALSELNKGFDIEDQITRTELEILLTKIPKQGDYYVADKSA